MPEIKDNLRSESEEMTFAPKELFCGDFDISCFEVRDPGGCKKGKTARIGPVLFYTLPVTAICPISDEL